MAIGFARLRSIRYEARLRSTFKVNFKVEIGSSGLVLKKKKEENEEKLISCEPSTTLNEFE